MTDSKTLKNKRPKDYISLISKLQPFKVSYIDGIYINNKPPIEELGTTGYLYAINKKKLLDENDTKFITEWNSPEVDIEDGWNMKEFIGKHTYGGYYGFFRPDLIEVINIIGNDVRDIPSPIYVTTNPCSQYGKITAQISECYDRVSDLQYGKTVIYWGKTKKKKRKRTKKKKTKKKRRLR
jgi:hypothetical protein